MRVADLTKNDFSWIINYINTETWYPVGFLWLIGSEWDELPDLNVVNTSYFIVSLYRMWLSTDCVEETYWEESLISSYILSPWCCHTGVTQTLILSGRLHWWISLLIVLKVKYQGWNLKHICPITYTGNEQCPSMNFLSVCVTLSFIFKKLLAFLI